MRLPQAAVALALLSLAASAAPAGAIRQSAREIPVAHSVDVVIVGGSTAAVAGAEEAANSGASVFLAAPRPYLGEDLCATLRLRLAEGQTLGDPLAERLFQGRRETTPLVVKKVLDKILLEAEVRYLYGCYATDVLRDRGGKPAGIVMANRAGRQAVVAKVIIDATDRAWIARMAGAAARPWPDGRHRFERTLIVPGGDGRTGSGEAVTKVLGLSVPGGGFTALAAAEQAARDETYVDGQLRAAERLFYVPPDSILGRTGAAEWKDSQRGGLGHFQPQKVERLYVLSAMADVPRNAAAEMLRPTGLIEIARRIGRAAAAEAESLPAPEGVCLPQNVEEADDAGDVCENLGGLRPADRPRKAIASGARRLPVLGRYDVVVVGGGTAGAPATIGAARRGARTLVIEYQEALGGTGTLGLITRPYHGNFIGFTREVPFPDREHNVEHKMEWYRREIRRAGGDIWFGVLGCGAVVQTGRVRGVVVATPEGRGAVLARCVIDSTGNADLAAAAGAEVQYGAGDEDIAMQGAGRPPRPLTRFAVNTDYLLVDETDMLDTWRALVGTRLAMKLDHYDSGPLIQTRERRRIVGDHVLRYLDQIAGRTYPDSVVYSSSDYDAHGYPIDPYFALFPHDEKSLKAHHPAPGGPCYTPYRCLLPRGLDGILVAGIGISMDRDASALVRMQRDVQNQGYAAGVAATMVARADGGTRQIDVKALQKHLVEIGNLPPEVLEHEDPFPLPEEAVGEAVTAVGRPKDRGRANQALAIVLSHQKTARPLLEAAFAEAEGEKKLVYAKILGFLGDRRAVPVLIEALDRVEKWDDKVYQGKMAEYAHLPTPVDGLVMALGQARDRRALPAIFRVMEKLDAKATLSHHRAVALALETIADPAAAEPLAALLRKPGMTGHALTAVTRLPASMKERRDREAPLREIVLARALYRCGDAEGLGEDILRQYRNDLRGLFSRHAAAVLGK